MDKRFLATLVIVCFALADVGCSSKQVEYELMPSQTGSTLRRRVAVESSTAKKTERGETKRTQTSSTAEKTKRRETKRTQTKRPAQPPQQLEDESTAPPDRFR